MRRGIVVLTLAFQSEGRRFESQPGVNFLRQEIHPQFAALDPGEVNGDLVGIFIP